MNGWRRSLATLTLVGLWGSALADVLDEAMSRYSAVDTYAVTLRSSEVKDGPFREVIHYLFRKPGWVRMDFIYPHAGMVLIYNPEKKVVRLWPWGQKGPDFLFSPDNLLLRSVGNERVDYSDIGTLLSRAQALRKHGSVKVLGEEPLNRHTVLHVRITGQGDEEVVEGVHRFDLWLDVRHLMPLRVEAYDPRDMPMDVVLMDDLELNVPLLTPVFDAP